MKQTKQKHPAKPLNRRQKYLWISSITTVLLVLALILGNILLSALAKRYPLTLDLTRAKVFELTDESKKYIEELPQEVSIKVMESEDNFASGGEYFVQANAVLHQYDMYSDKVSLSYVDLLANPTLAGEYEDVQMGDILVSSGDRVRKISANDLFEVESSSYYGKYITASKAEQVMTSAIMGVVSPSEISVGVLSGHGEQYQQKFVSLLQNNNFAVSTISPAVEEIPEDMDVLLWVAPTTDPDEDVLQRIDKFLSEKPGRTLLYFADTTQPALPAIEKFLNKWGISVELSSVIETDNNKIVNANPYFSTTTLMGTPLTDTMLDTSVPMTMPFSRPLKTVFETNMDRTTALLFQSSDTSSLISYDLTEEELESWKPEEYGPFPMGIMTTQKMDGDKTSQVVAFSSAVSISDALLSSSSFANSDYYLSVMNTLTERENVISIQSKVLGGQELGLNTAQAFTIGSVFMIVLPIIVLCGGIYVWFKRRNA